jgi:hypothetical protein
LIALTSNFFPSRVSFHGMLCSFSIHGDDFASSQRWFDRSLTLSPSCRGNRRSFRSFLSSVSLRVSSCASTCDAYRFFRFDCLRFRSFSFVRCCHSLILFCSFSFAGLPLFRLVLEKSFQVRPSRVPSTVSVFIKISSFSLGYLFRLIVSGCCSLVSFFFHFSFLGGDAALFCGFFAGFLQNLFANILVLQV